MSIRFSYRPADQTLTLMIRGEDNATIEHALDRAGETGALEVHVLDGSRPHRWPVIAEMCTRRGSRFVYRRAVATPRAA
ncbi:MAG: hypothetical protein AAF411_23095 [Myxococcota bacterium]